LPREEKKGLFRKKTARESKKGTSKRESVATIRKMGDATGSHGEKSSWWGTGLRDIWKGKL